MLEELALKYPLAVARNTVAPLLLLEEPAWGTTEARPLYRWADWHALPDDARAFYGRIPKPIPCDLPDREKARR